MATRPSSGTEHHAAAAEQHDEAADCHRRASRHYEQKSYVEAAREGLLAQDHTRRAAHHAREAAAYRLGPSGRFFRERLTAALHGLVPPLAIPASFGVVLVTYLLYRTYGGS